MEATSSKRGKLVVISGPAGVGKSTIVRQALAATGAQYSVSVTTRPMRLGEVDGRDYRFVGRAAFEEMIREGRLLEWAEVFGNLYGTPSEPVQQAIAQGRTIILEIDVQGALQVAKAMPSAEFVLILPPDQRELEARLKGRGSEDEESLRRRLGKARQEIDTARASGVYHYIVVNDDLKQAVTEVVRIVQGESSE